MTRNLLCSNLLDIIFAQIFYLLSFLFYFIAVDNAKEDEEDFLKALESAISGNEPEPEEVEKVASESISKCENKEEEEASKLNQENDEVTKDEGEKETPHNGNGVSTDSDAEKLENDLLNDSDDINKEVDDLLASITAEELNSDEPANTDKQIVDKSKETADECSTQKEKSEAEVLEDKLLADPLEDELLNEAACVVSNSEEGESKEKITDVSTEVKNQEPAENQESREPETNDETTHSRKVSEDEPKGEDLLVACESPKPTETPSEQENKSETSSNSGETPEDSSDEKQRATESENADENKDIEDKVKPIKVVAVTQLEGMEIDELEDDSKEGETLPAEGDEVHLCMIEPTKEKVQFKINFMRKFASAVGVLSRAELEELLVQKITESFMFCSENTELRSRLEKQEKNCETFRKQLENLNKQYNDLHMIHIRVQKDLKDRPESAITPVKITRAVGLQVFSPMARQKPNQILNFQSNLHQTTIKPSNKRPASELEPVSNGKSPDSVKRKKTTPLRPQLTDKERQMLDNQEAKVEQKIRSTVIGGSTVKLPPNVTISPIQNGTVNGTSNHSSIDLTDDEESSGSAQQPPALVAIRASNGSLLQRKAFVVKTSGLATSIRSHAIQSKF